MNTTGLVRNLLLTAVLPLFAACSEEQVSVPPAQPAAAAQAGAAATSAADTVYLSGDIYRVDEANSRAEAMAVTDGVIVAVGSDAEIGALAGADTKRVDLGGRMVMPGIHDMHVHPKEAGETHHFQCGFPFSLRIDEIIAKIRECAAATPKGEWIRGGQWAMELLDGEPVPHRALLDAVTTEHPVYLGDSTVHGAWLNSLALQKLGIDASTPDPNGGTILRDPDSGEPTGVLIDNAAYDVLSELPVYTHAQYETALEWAMLEMNQVGVTTIKDALTDSYGLAAYKRLADAGRLSMKVKASLGWKMSWIDSAEQERSNIERRAEFSADRLDPNFIKIMLDGTPPTRTAGMLEPYVADEAHGADFLGELIHTPEQLAEDVVYLDAQGLTVKIHATGDRAVRVSLDAFAAARRANGASGLLHEVSHAELIHPDDRPRFKALNVIAELCPILWYPTPLVAWMAQIIGEDRANQFWPIKAMQELGAHQIYGSDWPSVVPDPNPWPGIEAMVSRRDPYGKRPGALWPEQAIDLATTLRIFIINGAVAGKQADRTGSLEVGKAADFIVLDRNLFNIPVEEIGDTQVLLTVIDGAAVYRSNA